MDVDWIAVDWGTTHPRAWAMGPNNEVLDRRTSRADTENLRPEEFETALLHLITPWLSSEKILVIACGAVGATPGWTAVPCKPGTAMPILSATKDPRLTLYTLPGVCQTSPADVMWGEEMQAAGVIEENPQFDGVLCLPGTHTKWVHVSAEEIVSFRTAMTGELFTLLSAQSVLRQVVDGEDLDQNAFDTAVTETLSRPERLAQSLFNIQAEALLHGQGNAVSRARLSGLLIGADLAAARPYWLGQQVLVAGAPQLSALYSRALEMQGVPCLVRDAGALTLAGLCRARARLAEAT